MTGISRFGFNAAICGLLGSMAACGGADGNSLFPSEGTRGLDAGKLDSQGGIDSASFMFGTREGGIDRDSASVSDAPIVTNDDAEVLAISPSALQTIVVPAGQTMPTVTYSATLNGAPVSAAWSVDRGDLATIPSSPSPTAALSPTGSTGGIVTVTAGFNGKTVQAKVLIQLTAQQNGLNPSVPSEQPQVATMVPQLTAGGGVGGVGGEGLGQSVTDPGALAALGAPNGNGQMQGLKFLYPYDKTVWPRGMTAPLLMWDWQTGDADAILISLATASGSFSWTGTFAPPTILGTTGGPFIRHPIPQDVWDMATNSAGGTTPAGLPDTLTVSLTVEKGGVAYGPIHETWPIAPALLSGIIYYNSYGTQLAKNYGGAVGGDGKFGGAVLSIHVGDTGPQLVAGTNGGTPQCRTCHSVAAGGSRLVVQHGDSYGSSSAYDLNQTGSVEHDLTNGSSWFPGMYPDGSLALTESGQILPLPDDSTLPTVNGLSAVATDIGTPSFSPDGKLVTFNPLGGPGVTAPKQSIMVMGFDVATDTFSNPVVIVDDTGQPSTTRPGWPAFFPDAQSVVFHHQSAPGDEGSGDGDLHTREGAKAQISWTNITDATHVTPLNQLNGLDAMNNSYLPTLTNPPALSCTGDGYQVGNINPAHDDDVDLNYEPTVNPIASGGYVWIVFTSRRMYGSEATIPPFCSDPRGVDLVKNITTKKLWVAAVDLGAAPGSDASHPAFYLPAQELLAGNSRGFWVLDPCKADGQSCASGDQCCNGYCEADGEGGALICANTPPNNACSGLNDKCTSAADCCDSTNLCVNGFCTQAAPPPPPAMGAQ